MEFTENQNPEKTNDDLRVGEETIKKEQEPNDFKQMIYNLFEKYDYIIEEPDLEQMPNVSLGEYLHPTSETVLKIEEYLQEKVGRTR